MEALEVVRARPEVYDLVITDQMMPKLAGLDLAKELLRIRPDFPIILMSGYTEQDAVSQFGNTDLTGFIQKPIQQEQLQAIVQRALGQPVDQFRSKS